MKKRQPKKQKSVLQVFWPYVAPSSGKMTLALGILILDTTADLAAPWPVKLIFDNVLLGKPLKQPWSQILPQTLAHDRQQLFIVLGVALLVFALVSALSTYVGMRLLGVIGQRIIFLVRSALFDHLQQLSPGFYDRQRLGDLMTRLTSDIQSIQDLLVSALPLLLLNFLLVVGLLGVLVLINRPFGLLGLISAVIIFLVLWGYVRRIKQVTRQTRRSESEANALVQEHLRGIRVVQAFGLQDQAKNRYEEKITHSLETGIVAARLQSGLPSVVGLMTDLGALAALVVGGILALQGQITVGDLLVFSAYLRAMYSPLRQLSKLLNTFTRASACAERVTDLLQTDPDVKDHPEAIPTRGLQHGLVFNHVSFRYNEQRQALHDVSFQVRPGMMVALVGHTGAGKSSILHLLQRFYDPQQGQIFLDGRDIRQYTLASLRQHIALVPQDPMLFRASIRENIVYGRPGASDAEIVAAARLAYADTFISRLPEGYNTMLEEQGVGLSGGQRQLLAIARAILRQAPLQLLDEPTTGLDAQSEQTVVQALDQLMAGRTTVVSAHRLSTIQKADLVLVIEKGHLVESGTPAELLAARGHYYHFYKLQSGGQEPVPVTPRPREAAPIQIERTSTTRRQFRIPNPFSLVGFMPGQQSKNVSDQETQPLRLR